MNELRWTSSGWKTKGGGGQMTRCSRIPLAIINVWNRPACWYLPLHPIAAPHQPVGFISSPYIQTVVRVLVKKGRTPPLVNHKQHCGFHSHMRAACKEGTICANHGLSLNRRQFDKFAISESEPGLLLPTCWRQWYLLHPKTNRIINFGSSIRISYISATTSKFFVEIVSKCHVNTVNMAQVCQ